MTKILVYDIDAETIDDLADSNGTSIAEIVEILVSNYLENLHDGGKNQ